MQFAAPALSVVGGAFSAIGQMQQAGAQSDAYKAQAVLDKQEGQVSADVAAARAAQRVKEGRKVAAQTRAAAGSSGAVANSGSVMDLLASSRAAYEQDAANESYQGLLALNGAQTAASFNRFRARSAMAAGRAGAFSSVLQGVTSAAGSYPWGQ